MSVRGSYALPAVGRLVTGNGDQLWVPKAWTKDASKPLVVYHHGAGGTALYASSGLDSTTNPNAVKFMIALAASFPVMLIDGGTTASPGVEQYENWGNPYVQAATHTAIAAAKTLLGTDPGPVLSVGGSMGNVTGLNCIRANPGDYKAHLGIIPAFDIDDIRDNNRGGLRASTSAAWNTGTWVSNGNPALPAGANPYLSPSVFTALKQRYYYSTGDTIVLPAKVAAWAAAVGSNASSLMCGTNDHSDAAVGDIPITDVITWLQAQAALFLPPMNSVWSFNFEANDFSEWTSETDTASRIAPAAGAGKYGNNGARVLMTTNTSAYILKDFTAQTSTLKIAFWMRMSPDFTADSSPGQSFLLRLYGSAVNRWDLALKSSGNLTAIDRVSFQAVNGTSTLSKGVWHYVEVVITGIATASTTINVFVDGVLDSTQARDWSAVPSVGRIQMGLMQDQAYGAVPAGYLDFDAGFVSP